MPYDPVSTARLSDKQCATFTAMNKWLPSWKKKGWRKLDGKPVKNVDLIQYADLLLEERRSGLKQSVSMQPCHTYIHGFMIVYR